MLVRVGYNAEEGGFTTTEVAFAHRLPVRGERIEFRDPEGGESDWPADLDGNVFFVAEVNWVAGRGPGFYAIPTVILVPKSEWDE